MYSGWFALVLAVLGPIPGTAFAKAEVQLPSTSPKVVEDFPENDPLFTLESDTMPMAEFSAAIGSALDRSPLVAADRASRAEAEAVRQEARSALFPVVDVTLVANQSLARNFSNDPTLIVERTRPDRRVDANASLQQLLFDFGASSSRIAAAAARIEVSEADAQQTGEAVTLRAIGAWYDTRAYGTLVNLSVAYLKNQELMRDAIEQRIRQGFSPPVDRAKVASAIAEASLRLEQARRAHGNSKARYSEMFGTVPTESLRRSLPPVLKMESSEQTLATLKDAPAIRSAQASARAATLESKAARADTLPQLTAGIDAGRYGVFEKERNDYDVRGQLILRFRFGGGKGPRADQLRARAAAAAARAEAVETEAARELAIALSDVETQQSMLPAYRTNYLAARTTRDAVFERFRVARGTLFDLLDAEMRVFNAAGDYVRAVSEADTAAYTLMARIGLLNKALGLRVPGTDAMP